MKLSHNIDHLMKEGWLSKWEIESTGAIVVTLNNQVLQILKATFKLRTTDTILTL